MSRYVERAENIARIVDVNLQVTLDLPARTPEESKTLWDPVLRSTTDGADFHDHYKVTSGENVIEFLALNPHNLNSIINCLTHARENARHVREQISLEPPLRGFVTRFATFSISWPGQTATRIQCSWPMGAQAVMIS